MAAYIEAYAYSEGPASNTAAAALQTAQTFAVSRLGVTAYARPATPQRFSDLLSTWASQLTTATGVTVGMTYSATTHRVTLTGSAAILPVIVGNGATFTGFTGSFGPAATSWTAASAPAGRVDLLGVMVEPAEDWTHIDLAQYRHGRARAVAWGNHQVHKVTCYATGDGVAAFQAGYVQAGRVRISQGSVASYAPDTPEGYIDGWVIGCGPGVEQSPALWSWDMLIGVPR